MENLKQIQEFFSKPLNENKVLALVLKHLVFYTMQMRGHF